MSQDGSNYDSWAWLYNHTLGPDYCASKQDFLNRNLVDHMPLGARILDLCCGTGQMIAPLMQKGFAVTGLDYSAEMLNCARENAPDAELIQGDARNFSFDEPFDSILSMSASLNHMESLDDLGQVFGCAYRALHEDGIFVFDVNHPAQMSAHWNGQPAQGKIRSDHAWLITPNYDAEQHTGAFTVDIWRKPENAPNTPIKNLTSRVLSLSRLRKRRLAQLARFEKFRPNWEHRSADYPIRGHDLDKIEDLLRETGFDVRIETVNGEQRLDDRNSAHFVCQKRPTSLQSKQTQSDAEAK